MKQVIEFDERTITIYGKDEFYPEEAVEISWSSIGSVSIERAERFAEELEKAISKAKTL